MVEMHSLPAEKDNNVSSPQLILATVNKSVIFSSSRVYLPSSLKGLNIPWQSIRTFPGRIQDTPSGVKIFPAQTEKASPTELKHIPQ